MEAGMATKATVESRVVHQVWLGIWLVLAAYVTFQTLQQHFGFGLTKTLILEPQKIVKDGDTYSWKLPHRYRNPLMYSRVQLLEDGQPFSRVDRLNSLIEHGAGWFLVANIQVKFLVSAGENPQTNGRRYEVVMPVQYEGMELWVPWLALLGASWMVARRGLSWPLRLHAPRHELALVFLLSLVVTSWRVHQLGVYSDGSFNVCGEPQSDAAGWFMMAQGIAEGWGITGEFSGQRPIYGAMIAPLYFLPGDPLTWFLGFNVVLLGVAAVAVYALASLLSGRLLATVATAAVVVGDNHLVHIMNVSTETAGLALGLVSALALALALRDDRRWYYAVGGLLVGLANLASGATMLSIPALAFLVLAGSWVKGGLRHALASSAIFTVGVSLVFLPWMIRQKVVVGTFSPSLNSGTLLRSGADPRISWADIHHDAQQTGGVAVGDLAGANAHHMKHFRQLVAADPIGYVQRVLAQWVQSFQYFKVNDPGFRAAGFVLLLLLALLAVIQRRNVAGLVVALALGTLWYQLERQQSLFIAVLGYLALIWHFRRTADRWLVPLMLLHLGSATFLVGGMAANQTISRTWQVVGWSLQLPALASLGLLWAWLSSAAERLQPWCRGHAVEDGPESGGLLRGTNTLIMATTTYCLFAITISMAAVLLGPDKRGKVTIHPAVLEQALAHVAQHYPGGPVSSARLNIKPVRLGYRQHFQPAGHDPASWLSHLKKAAFDRWFYSLEAADIAAPPDQRFYGYGQTAVQPRSIAPNEAVLWVSEPQIHRSSIDGSSYTVHNGLAIVPLNRGEPDLSGIQWLKPCPPPSL